MSAAQMGLPEEIPEGSAPVPQPRYGEGQGRLTLPQIERLERRRSGDALQPYYMAGFYQDEPAMLVEDMTRRALVQYLAHVIGEYWPSQLLQEYGEDEVRLTLWNCANVFECHDWRRRGIRKPAAYLRWLLRSKNPPEAVDEGRGWFNDPAFDADERNARRTPSYQGDAYYE